MAKTEVNTEYVLLLKKAIDETKIDIDKAIDTNQKRVDVLLSSISGGGLFLIFHVMSNVGFEKISFVEVRLLSWSAVLFVMTLLLNYFNSKLALMVANHMSKTANSQKTTINDLLLGNSIPKKLINLEEVNKYKYVDKINTVISFLVVACLLAAIILLGCMINIHIESHYC